MQITREEINPVTIQLTVVCDPEQVDNGFNKAFKQISKNIRVPGFRPGHAPKALLEQMIPPDRLYDTAAENIIRSAYKSALEEQELKPYGQPSVELKKLNHEEKECEFLIKVPLEPKVELTEYKGVSVEKPIVEISDQDVEQQIEVYRQRRSTREAVTGRGVQEGDVAVVNVKVDGEEGEGRNFMTVAGQTFPQLDQALLGMQVEEMKSLDLTFPDNFQEQDWAGKLLHCQVTLRSLSAVKLPELDEEFAKSLQTESVDELRGQVKQMLEARRDAMVEEYVVEQLYKKLIEQSNVHVPMTMAENVAGQKLQDMQSELEQQNKTLEQYAQENGMTLEQLVEAQKQEAEMFVKRSLIVQEIAKRENMSITNSDLNDELVLMSREVGMKPEEVLNALKKNRSVQELEHRAIFRKVSQFLSENADVQEVPAGQNV